ncbi:uncharacterized protein PITG_20227 [Phytophthora infestans T30-4]|uniref:Uncharacterized protein n=1 Tax=Phytophthora infestans (strain T30-4) TaxID=403677 RepID=D0P1B3_PHYIT|nr:uncharacterized protein PITG_20227 [Phytophthora infestans T30-4]EEY54139.1 hypothetical protein PITG_20227 [Phytophthora infestans T30-4]|eukprot:XP_002895899.1 hypothetical protein PITG_20227 [Phytophthora infestans T30-4]
MGITTVDLTPSTEARLFSPTRRRFAAAVLIQASHRTESGPRPIEPCESYKHRQTIFSGSLTSSVSGPSVVAETGDTQESTLYETSAKKQKKVTAPKIVRGTTRSGKKDSIFWDFDGVDGGKDWMTNSSN